MTVQDETGMVPVLNIFVSSGAANLDRRRAVRNSWMQYKLAHDSPLSQALRDSVTIHFVISRASGKLQEEMDTFGDIVLVDAPEGYGHLWRKALVYLEALEARAQPYAYAMHADDDSFVRLDLLLPYLATCPRERFYWGYIWDGTGNRMTAPIRNPLNKSHMPVEQYAPDFYPPFASGCGFVLSRDLVQALAAAAPRLPDYRLLDPPFGIHLCAAGPACVLSDPVTPVHDERVRPYRPIPMFRPDSLVQHYMRPEEMRPYYLQALQGAEQKAGAHAPGTPGLSGLFDERGAASSSSSNDGGASALAPQQLYDTLVQLGLLRR